MLWQGEGADLTDLTRGDLRRLARDNADKLPREFHTLGQLVNWAENGGAFPNIDSDDPVYFYTLRAADTPDAELVNMLLAELAPKDIRQLFICHKDLFYDTYAAWPEGKKAYVADFLERAYKGTKRACGMHCLGMRPKSKCRHCRADVKSRPPWTALRVGPWGAVKRR